MYLNKLKMLLISLFSSMMLLGSFYAAEATQPVNRDTQPEWQKAYGPYKAGEYSSLPHEMTPEEKVLWDSSRPDVGRTDPPRGRVRQTAEFEAMEGVLIRYPLGISYDIVAEMSEDVIVYTIVSSRSVMNQAINNYQANGVNLDNCEFIIAPTDSYWTRDYGPWWITHGKASFSIVDFTYNRPRPNDDNIPGVVSRYFRVPKFEMDLIHAGGNYMTDGMGIAASTDLVLTENPDKTVADIEQIAQDFLGIHTYHIVPDPNGAYIDHIDTWGKFLDVDKILIREVPITHSQYDEIEATVAYFSDQISSYGTQYEIYRVYTPNDQPYTNSLILNDKVLVPMNNSIWDDDAIAAYEDAMPGYQVLGFTGSWVSTDALHCRARGIPDNGMLYIKHFPIINDQPTEQSIVINATIVPYSGERLERGYPEILWKDSPGSSYISEPMTRVSRYQYEGSIPAQASEGNVYYYIHAEDMSGRVENHPFIGGEDPHIFSVVTGEPDIKANGSDGPLTMRHDNTLSVTIELNAGSLSGDNADWWVLADTPFGWYYDNLSSGWQSGQSVTYMGPLFNLDPYEVLNMSGLRLGDDTFYFGVDMNMNGTIDMGRYIMTVL
jgi:agmatine/peptidylarginine deiminase